MAPSTRGTAEKLSLFRACFSGLDRVYGTYDPQTGRSHQVKQPVTDQVLLRHLQGRQPYGVYLLVGERTAAAVADFDRDEVDPPLRFVRHAREFGIAAYLERSKHKGWHAWVFFEKPGVNAAKARLVVRWMLGSINAPQTEVFPKQDRLEDRNRFGNFVNAPLFGALVPQGRTVFVDPDSDLKPWPDQWQVLETLSRVGEPALDDIIAANHLISQCLAAHPTAPGDSGSAIHSTYGLPPCAQRILAEGVTAHQRVACFRLALHLKKAGLPEDLALICLRAWSRKNRPSVGKRMITPEEINVQARAAYGNAYRGCGCEEPVIQPFCDVTCPLHGDRGESPAKSL